MYTRLTILNVKPEKIQEAIETFRKSVIPAAKLQKGFVAAYLLQDRQTGKGMALTFWKSEAAALANEHNLYYQEQLVKFIEMLASPPIREGYEVRVKG